MPEETPAEETPAEELANETPADEPAEETPAEGTQPADTPEAARPAESADAPLSAEQLREALADAPATVTTSGPAPAPEDAPPAAPRRVPTGPSLGTGRRKEAVARVRVVPGTGRFELNGQSLEGYFPTRAHRMLVAEPLRLAGRDKDFDVIARIHGGGVSGQAGAVRLGIARALVEFDPDLRPALKAEGMLTRDAREKERRKYGLKKARKAPQYSKR